MLQQSVTADFIHFPPRIETFVHVSLSAEDFALLFDLSLELVVKSFVFCQSHHLGNLSSTTASINSPIQERRLDLERDSILLVTKINHGGAYTRVLKQCTKIYGQTSHSETSTL